MDLAGINFSVLVSNFSVLILALEPVNGKFDDVCRDVMASKLILNTRSDNEPELDSETKLEVVGSVNIEEGTENSSHATVDRTTALAAVCALVSHVSHRGLTTRDYMRSVHTYVCVRRIHRAWLSCCEITCPIYLFNPMNFNIGGYLN